jgi:dUTP pyrophosphatase
MAYTTKPINRSTSQSAGHELLTDEDIYLAPGARMAYPVGFHVVMQPDQFMLVKAKSSLTMRGIDVGAGVIDADYVGVVKVILINNSATAYEVKAGTSIAQGILLRYEVFSNAGVTKDSSFVHTGFGSTN